MIKNELVFVNGDGETNRDFCQIDNTVHVNLLAAVTDDPDVMGQRYNVAVSDRITLNQFSGRYARRFNRAFPT